MKRTTLAIRDEVLAELKRRAAEQGTTVQVVANDLLQQAILARSTSRAFKLRLPAAWKARARPGVDITDRDQLFDLMDEA